MIPVDVSNGYFCEEINKIYVTPEGSHPGGKYIACYGHLNAQELPDYHLIAKYAQIGPELLDFFNLTVNKKQEQERQDSNQIQPMETESEDSKMDDEILEDEREEVHLMDDLEVG